MAICYEWTAELLDSEGEIEEVYFFDSYEELEEFRKDLSGPFDIGLVKSKSNKSVDDTDSTAYAYVIDGMLETEFDDGSKVPMKYLNKIKFKL